LFATARPIAEGNYKWALLSRLATAHPVGEFSDRIYFCGKITIKRQKNQRYVSKFVV
jgi:hypothetical protein